MIVKNPIAQALLMILASGAVFMDYLDTSIVSIALPAISQSTGMSSTGSSWVMTSYLLALGSTLLLFGKIADRTGRHKLIFISGFALFTLSSIFCGLSTSMILLIIFRVVQGIAAAAMVSTSTMLITLHLPLEKQGFATGVIATLGGVALACGPFVGGILTEFISWHWIFFINIPIGIIGIIMSIFLIPKYEKQPSAAEKKPFDVIGAALLAASLIALLAGFELGASDGWSLPIILLIVISPMLMAVFLRRELNHPDPVMSTKLLLSRTIMFSSLCMLLITVVFLGMIYIMPFYLTSNLGYGAALAGIIMLIPPVVNALIGIPAGALTKKFGCMRLCNVAAICQALGMLMIVFSIIISNLPILFIGLGFVGLGTGMNEAPGIRRVNIHAPINLQGSSSGLVFTVMNVGCVIGVALFSIVATIVSDSTVFTNEGVYAACLAGAFVSILAYISSRLARDTIKY
ncbi:MAG: MFS transporter [Methanocorpusculum sp.]|nr:MFS transporter [Methanocorpusculum sp.]